jgi:hypothetical protein
MDLYIKNFRRCFQKRKSRNGEIGSYSEAENVVCEIHFIYYTKQSLEICILGLIPLDSLLYALKLQFQRMDP